LTERGEQQARAAGVALRQLGASFEAVLFSPRVRARRTAELAAQAWSEEQRARLQEYAPLAGGFDAEQALTALSGLSADARLLLIGHEPDLSRVAGELTGARADIKKGGLAVVRLDGIPAHPAGGELVVLVRPRELALIAGVPLGRE
jgi:phosphohistidine phosphatase